MVSFHAMVSYFNLYVLVPQFLMKKKYLSYFFSLIMSVVLVGFPMAVIFYLSRTVDETSKQDIWSPGFFVANIVTTSYAIAITMTLKLMKQWYEKERFTQQLEKVNMETELKYLKSQINPHFLFNSLNSLYALTLKKSDHAPELVLKLSDILRYLLYEAGEKQVTLEKELNYLRNYLEMEQLRQGERVTLTFTVSGNPRGQMIEPMLFIPFVENSFKHGINNNVNAGWIRIHINIEDRELFFSIDNSKPANAEKPADYKGGIGVENIRKRLLLLYPDRHVMEVKDTPNVYSVNLHLMLK